MFGESCRSAEITVAQSPVQFESPAKIATCEPKFLDNFKIFILLSIFLNSTNFSKELSLEPSSTKINSYKNSGLDKIVFFNSLY